MKLNIPFVGIISKTGFTESYDFKKGEEFDFHHDHIMSPKALDIFNYDNTLRFRLQKDTYILEGTPSLNPFGTGAEQIKKFTKHTLSKGANPKTKVKIAQQRMRTPYEGKTIGTLEELNMRIR